MMQQAQPKRRNAPKRDRLATHRCNPLCDHESVSDYDEGRQAAALTELDALSAAFKAAETQLELAREALREGIVRHLKERNAPPGKVAEHTPYDRNHVRRIAEAGGVEPLRAPTVKSAKSRRRG